MTTAARESLASRPLDAQTRSKLLRPRGEFETREEYRQSFDWLDPERTYFVAAEVADVGYDVDHEVLTVEPEIAAVCKECRELRGGVYSAVGIILSQKITIQHCEAQNAFGAKFDVGRLSGDRELAVIPAASLLGLWSMLDNQRLHRGPPLALVLNLVERDRALALKKKSSQLRFRFGLRFKGGADDATANGTLHVPPSFDDPVELAINQDCVSASVVSLALFDQKSRELVAYFESIGAAADATERTP